MRKSTNYGLKLMEGTDNVKRQDFVDNFEIIDREMKNNDTQVKEIANDSYPIVEATGTNAYVGSTARITKLSKGTRCTLFVSTSSTGNCNLNLNNYGVKNIKDSFGNIVTNLKANIPYNLCYNGSDFILQGKGGGGNATADKLLSGSTATVDSGPIAGTMTNQGSKTATLNCGGKFIIPKGYHSGDGYVQVNSLASQTPANATAEQILAGFSAWVNGTKVDGNYIKNYIMNVNTSFYDGEQKTYTFPYVPSLILGSYYCSGHGNQGICKKNGTKYDEFQSIITRGLDITFSDKSVTFIANGYRLTNINFVAIY